MRMRVPLSARERYPVWEKILGPLNSMLMGQELLVRSHNLRYKLRRILFYMIFSMEFVAFQKKKYHVIP